MTDMCKLGECQLTLISHPLYSEHQEIGGLIELNYNQNLDSRLREKDNEK